MHAIGPIVSGPAKASWKTVFYLILILAFEQGSRAQNTTYIYDELGRLVGVVNPTGAAKYVYDATGNIISISRFSSTQVSIIEFTPKTGPTSATVKIYGTGFSATATQDKVEFNGLTATIQSASATEIVATVPVGATTGPIKVITPAGSTSSSQPFTVGLPSGPTITGFTPKIGSLSTAVSVSGTNFQTSTASDAVRFNLTLAQIASATASKMNTSVPIGATSGHISVSTPFGRATSSADFFAPPPPYIPSDVASTGRMSTGTTSKLSINTGGGKIGLMIFDEQSGHRVGLLASNSTFTSCTLGLSIISPSGVTLASGFDICIPGFLDTATLADDGTYTILATTSASGTRTGSVSLSLYDIAHDFMSSITPGGGPVDVKLTIPGQNAELTFNGTSGERVSLSLTNGTFPLCSLNVSIINPDGTTLTSATCVGTGGFVGALALPMTGTYTILLTPSDASTGSIVATLYKVVNITGTIAINGSAITVKLTTPGQNAVFTFSGTGSEKATVHVTNNTIACLTTAIVNPNRTLLFSELDCGSSFNLPTQTLPVTGTYTLSLTGFQADTGSLTVKITSP
jgi:YD repeat-containing protein